eukprot:6549807-Prymnesium_polylepis.1
MVRGFVSPVGKDTSWLLARTPSCQREAGRSTYSGQAVGACGTHLGCRAAMPPSPERSRSRGCSKRRPHRFELAELGPLRCRRRCVATPRERARAREPRSSESGGEPTTRSSSGCCAAASGLQAESRPPQSDPQSCHDGKSASATSTTTTGFSGQSARQSFGQSADAGMSGPPAYIGWI